MIFVDSWIWIEIFSLGPRRVKAQQVLEQLKDVEAVISTAVVLEVRFVIRRKYGAEKAEMVVRLIEDFENLHIMPLTIDVAHLAADIRDKYHGKDGRTFSFADAIHLATAVLAGCERLYSGDPDLKGVDELGVVII